jgi:glycosyltransferase involved in cell wall biosynthesis
MKVKVLAYCDSPTCSTGFGIVSQHVLKALQDTGRYQIDVLGINYLGQFHNLPYTISPARLLDPSDPYGRAMFERAIRTKEYDVIWILNDTFVVQDSVPMLKKVKEDYLVAKKKFPKVIYYYPVDCKLLPQLAEMISFADVAVAYNDFGIKETLKIFPQIKLEKIPHGVDTSKFYPIKKEMKYGIRREKFHIADDTFLIINVNRNSNRKQLSQTLLAYSLFRQKNPNSMLYLHCQPQDNGIDLLSACKDLGLTEQQVLFPGGYSANKGIPDIILNQLYGAADMFISNHLGEGWGLCLDSLTKLDTYRGVISIKDILIGDQVVGGDGKFHKVLNKTSRIVEEILTIKTMYSSDIQVTAEHPFYVKTKDIDNPLWTKAKDIQTGDFLAIPKSTENDKLPMNLDLLDYLENEEIETDGEYIWYKMGYSPRKNGMSISDIQKKYKVSKRVAEDARRAFLNVSSASRGLPSSLAYSISQDLCKTNTLVNTQQLKIRRYIPITDEFLYFLGWYLSEGNNSNKQRIEIDLNIDELSFAHKLNEYLSCIFETQGIVEQNGPNKCRIRVSGQILAKVMGTICGIHSYNKRIPSFLLKSPQKLGPLMRSLFQGDGHLNYQRRHHSLSTISPSLAYQTKYICAANNILISTKEYPPKNIGKHSFFICKIVGSHLERWATFINQSFNWKIINRKSAVYFLEDKNYFYVKVKQIKVESKSTEVYDICVEDVHSFIANGVLVHNSVHEALACGLPVLVPDNTNMKDFTGTNGERGFLYPCKDLIFIDNIGYRPIGRMEDILKGIFLIHSLWKGSSSILQNVVKNAVTWCQKNTWQLAGEKWVELFDKVLQDTDVKKDHGVIQI